jgi:hypothetical protein
MVTIPVSWPAASITVSGTSIMTSTAGTGNVVVVTLSNETYSADGGGYTGTTRTCATSVPAVQIASGTAATLAKIPTGDTGFLSIALPDSLWDKITRVAPVTGSSTGLEPGATVTTDPSVALFGLASTSSFATAATAWPAACAPTCPPTGAFMASDLEATADGGTDYGDDDGDGNPGVTSVPVNMISGKNDYVLPPVSTSLTNMSKADQIYIVSRSEISATTKRLDCLTTSGTATVTKFENHVVGCHLTGGGSCDGSETSFLDSNRVIYTLKDGATIKTKVITGKANPSCADARAAVGFSG